MVRHILFNANSYDVDISGFTDKVDAIVTDPPYNISRDNNFDTMGRAGVDFGGWDKGADILSWIPRYVPCLKKDGCMVVFTSYQYISHIYDIMQQSGLDVKDIIVWRKQNPMPRNIERRYVQDMEFALWAVKRDAKWTFNKPENTPYLRSLYETPTVLGDERTEHPTQKSLKLMESILRIHANKGDTILDPFMGSGTTGVAALELGMDFIGIELSPKFYEIAKGRMANIQDKSWF